MSDLIHSCGLKFAFDVSYGHALSFQDFFGFEEEFDMIKEHVKHFDMGELEFEGTDSSCAKFTVVFSSACDPEDYPKVYQKALDFLNEINNNPRYNSSAHYYNHCLVELQEAGIVVYDNEPEEKVYTEYNRITHGHSNFKDYLASLDAAA